MIVNGIGLPFSGYDVEVVTRLPHERLLKPFREKVSPPRVSIYAAFGK
jgi:hypothetical protein